MGQAEDLAIELHEVWFVANSCLDLAEAHDAAKGVVDGCSPASALNDRPDTIGLGTAVADAWAIARDQLVTAINENARSCRDTSTALNQCIERFTSTDAEVQRELDAKKAEIPYE